MSAAGIARPGRPGRLPALLRGFGAATLVASLATHSAAEPAKEPGLGDFAGPAVDWGLRLRTSQTLEIDTNRTLDNPSDGAIYGVRSRLDAVIDAETKRGLYTTTIGLDAGAFGGPGANSSLNRIDPRLAFDLRYDGKTYRVQSGIAFEADSTSRTQIDDAVATDVDTTQFTLRYAANLLVALDRRNSFNGEVNLRAVEFADDVDGLTPTRTAGFSGSWLHQTNEVTTLNLTSGLRFFFADNDQDTQSQIASISGGITHQRTRRHRFSLSTGVTAVRTTEDAFTNDAGTTVDNSDDFSVGLNALAAFDYDTDGIDAGLNLSQQVEPSSLGEVQTFTRVAGDLSYPINERHRVAASLSFTRRSSVNDDGTGSRDVVRFGPQYSYVLARDTRLSLGYTFSVAREDASDTDSDSVFPIGHRVLLTFQRDFNILD